MQIFPFQDWVQTTNKWIEQKVQQYQAKSLFLPAGDTPKELYADWRKNSPDFLEKLHLLQVDDVIDSEKEGLFKKFFRDELPLYRVKYPQKGITADLAILGLGTNGHIAFHEPGLPWTFDFGEVDLADDTKKRLSLENSARGLTYGAATFLQAKAILLIVKGRKEDAYQKFMQKDADLPASALRSHSDLTLISEISTTQSRGFSPGKDRLFSAENL
ncbi:MAG: 6-phosphogluconolactonase [Oligoflexia bacterium]|nr:6-phosphogluconolactonase [Oligoflexia bacterium]